MHAHIDYTDPNTYNHKRNSTPLKLSLFLVQRTLQLCLVFCRVVACLIEPPLLVSVIIFVLLSGSFLDPILV